MQRDRQMEDFPLGSRVMMPSGRTGIVVRHSQFASKLDSFNRLTIQYESDLPNDTVQLQPRLLIKLAPSKDAGSAIQT